MTRDEHITRAMLLGMKYSEENRCYVKSHPTSFKGNSYVDCDTLESLTMGDVLGRINLGDFDVTTTNT